MVHREENNVRSIRICELLHLLLQELIKYKTILIRGRLTHGETFYINFYYSIFQFREKRTTLRIFVSKNTNLYNNEMKLQHSS